MAGGRWAGRPGRGRPQQSEERLMSNWIGLLPVTGIGSLEGFAFGVLASGACFLALTAPWRPRNREPGARYDVSLGSRQDRVHIAAAVREDLTPAAKPYDQPPDSCAGARAPGGAGRALARTEVPPDSRQHKAGGLRARHPAGNPGVGSAANPPEPGGRRTPRHAAPSSGLGSRMSRLGSKMTGLFSTRSLADDSRG
jgi:hypothetical protein